MSSIADANTSVEDIEKKSQSNEDDEDQKLGLYTVDTKRGDEALQLVGAERKEQFSEEYNLKLRRKLVRLSLVTCAMSNRKDVQDLWIPPVCAAVYFTQFLLVPMTSLAHTRL
jgi:ACS family allantoate permease-like MFS transporter